jgi:hypothetical protein
MTKEEIQRKIVGAVEMFETRSDGARATLIGILSACAGSLVVQAYEEAAQIADGLDSASNGNHARDVADEIRVLKDSLVSAETVVK